MYNDVNITNPSQDKKCHPRSSGDVSCVVIKALRRFKERSLLLLLFGESAEKPGKARKEARVSISDDKFRLSILYVRSHVLNGH